MIRLKRSLRTYGNEEVKLDKEVKIVREVKIVKKVKMVKKSARFVAKLGFQCTVASPFISIQTKCFS